MLSSAAPLIFFAMGALMLATLIILHAKWRSGIYAFASPIGRKSVSSTRASVKSVIKLDSHSSLATCASDELDGGLSAADITASTDELDAAEGGRSIDLGRVSILSHPPPPRQQHALSMRHAAVGLAVLFAEIAITAVLLSFVATDLADPQFTAWTVAYALAIVSLAPAGVLSFHYQPGISLEVSTALSHAATS